jgi:plastocyanin
MKLRAMAMMILGTTSVFLTACSSSNNPPPSEGNSSSSGGGSSSSSSGSATGAKKYKFDFAATANTLNNGKGQIINAHVGDTIIWTNDDPGIPHGIVPCTTDCMSTSMNGASLFTATGTGAPITGTAAGVDFPPVTFTAAGTYLYECSIHTTMMIGQVVVQ